MQPIIYLKDLDKSVKMKKEIKKTYEQIEKDFKNLGRPIKMYYKGKWYKIQWEPCIIVKGKIINIFKNEI